MHAVAIFLHGFGPRYDLPIAEWLYLYGAGGVVALSFVLVVVFAGDKVGSKAVEYPRLAVPWLLPVARASWPRLVGGLIGVLGLIAVIVCGLFGPVRPDLNPAEYITWIYFWAGTVLLSGLVGNLWYLLNPWAAIYDAVARGRRLRPPLELPHLGVWPAAALFLSFICLELTSGISNRPSIVAVAALNYTVLTLGGLFVFGRAEGVGGWGGFTGLFGNFGRVAPGEAGPGRGGGVVPRFS